MSEEEKNISYLYDNVKVEPKEVKQELKEEPIEEFANVTYGLPIDDLYCPFTDSSRPSEEKPITGMDTWFLPPPAPPPSTVPIETSSQALASSTGDMSSLSHEPLGFSSYGIPIESRNRCDICLGVSQRLFRQVRIFDGLINVTATQLLRIRRLEIKCHNNPRFGANICYNHYTQAARLAALKCNEHLINRDDSRNLESARQQWVNFTTYGFVTDPKDRMELYMNNELYRPSRTLDVETVMGKNSRFLPPSFPRPSIAPIKKTWALTSSTEVMRLDPKRRDWCDLCGEVSERMFQQVTMFDTLINVTAKEQERIDWFLKHPQFGANICYNHFASPPDKFNLSRSVTILKKRMVLRRRPHVKTNEVMKVPQLFVPILKEYNKRKTDSQDKCDDSYKKRNTGME